MLIFWEPMLLFPLLVMTIPVVILVGRRWRGGPLISLGAGATLGVVVELSLIWTSYGSSGYEPIYDTGRYLSLFGCAILLLGALALTFENALRARRILWALILCALVYGSFVGMLGFMLEPVRFCGELPSGTYCSPLDVGRFALFAALSLAGPIATLAYALLAQGRTAPVPASEQPEGLTI